VLSTIHQSLNVGTTAPQQQPLPLPSSTVQSILLTSEANVGDTGVLLPLVLSFYKAGWRNLCPCAVTHASAAATTPSSAAPAATPTTAAADVAVRALVKLKLKAPVSNI